MQNQLKIQYTVHNEFINNINQTVSTIQHNELHLKSKVRQYVELVKDRLHFLDIVATTNDFMIL